jgi:6-phosphogluconolactonase/glucosamine-6-phosphate isomerase/deaminase
MKFVKTTSEKDFVFIARGFMIDAFAASACPHMTFPTGNTPKPLYDSFKPEGELAGLSWRFSQLDEYEGLAAGDPRNFGDWLKRDLLDPLYVKDQDRLLFNPYTADTGSEVTRFSAEFKKRGRLDLGFFGVGKTGHLGLNEPPGDADSTIRVVTTLPESYDDNAAYWQKDYPDLAPLPNPLRGYSLGMREILASKHVVVMLRNKPELLKRIEQTTEPDPNFPVSLLRGHKNTTILYLG